jgi:hypothetical protein
MYTPTIFLLLHLRTYRQLVGVIFAGSQDTTQIIEFRSGSGSRNGSSQG